MVALEDLAFLIGCNLSLLIFWGVNVELRDCCMLCRFRGELRQGRRTVVWPGDIFHATH